MTTLPPGTISPIMAEGLIAQSGRRQLLLSHLRQRAERDAAIAAREAARASENAAQVAGQVAQTDPGAANAESTVELASSAQKLAFKKAGDAKSAAYHLSRLQQIRADELPTRRQSPTPRPPVAVDRRSS